MVKAVQDAADNDANKKRAARLLARFFTPKIPAGLQTDKTDEGLDDEHQAKARKVNCGGTAICYGAA
eukprot:3753798-Pleurochrysis_carterae.AAC.1